MKMRTVVLRVAIAIMLSLAALPAAGASAGANSADYVNRETFVSDFEAALQIQPVYPATPTFIDVPRSNPWYGEIEAAVAQGWMSGVTRTSFDPQGLLTRAEIAKIETIALGDQSEALQLMQTPTLFTDDASIPAWARGYINEAVDLGLIHGLANGSFAPDQPLTMSDESHFIGQYMAIADLQSPQSIQVSASPGIAPAGTPITLSSVVTDRLGRVISCPSLAYSVTPSGATVQGNVLTATADGAYTVTASCEAGTGTATVTVGPAGSSPTLSVQGPAFASAGTPYDVTLTLNDPSGATSTYSGMDTIQVSVSGDPGATVPSTVAFDNGTATLTITPSRPGLDTVNVTDSAIGGSSGASAPFLVLATGLPPQGEVAGPITLGSSDLTAGGTLTASVPDTNANINWLLWNNQTQQYYPILNAFGSPISTNLPEALPQGSYELVATDCTTSPTFYESPVAISSSWTQPTAASGRQVVDPFTVYNRQDMVPLFGVGYDGYGQTIALLETSDVQQSDIQKFDALFGLPPLQMVTYTPLGDPGVVGGTASTPSRALAEATIDVEWAHAMAPGAQIDLYVYPQLSVGEVAATAADAVIHGDAALSISQLFSAAPQPGTVPYDLLQSAESNLAIVAASGDSGFEPTASVPWPASESGVIAVGGAQYDGNSIDYWNSGSVGGQVAAGGYGTTAYQAQSQWNYLGHSTRTIPDVSFLARDAFTVIDGSPAYASGTSIGAPSWAGIWALAQDLISRNNSSPLGTPGSALYQIATMPVPAPAFVRSAGQLAAFLPNMGFGTPDVTRLVEDLLFKFF